MKVYQNKQNENRFQMIVNEQNEEVLSVIWNQNQHILTNLKYNLKNKTIINRGLFQVLLSIRESFQFTGIYIIEVYKEDLMIKEVINELGFQYTSSNEQYDTFEKIRIKNIIFDNGNVLSTFSPDFMISKFFDHDQDLIKKVVFGQIWNDLDQGIISEEDALALWKQQLPVSYHKALEEMFINWHHYLLPKEDMYEYILTIKDQYHCYLLSNAGVRHEVFKIPALDLMEGMVVSYQILINKPDPRIYQELLTKYQLDPRECLMIDDKEENIIEAIHQGMKGFIYHNNLEELKAYIKQLGV